MSKKEYVTLVKLPVRNSVGNFDGKLTDAILKLQGYLAMVPAEYQESAVIDIQSGDYDGASDIYTIHYYRPETKEEKAERLNNSDKVREQQKRNAEHQIADYRKRFPELFEDK